MSLTKSIKLFTSLIFLLATSGYAQPLETGPKIPHPVDYARQITARILPPPSTASPAMQKLDSRSINPLARFAPTNRMEWYTIIDIVNKHIKERVERVKSLFPVNIEAQMFADVNVYMVTPSNIPDENMNRILIYVHGGGFVFYGGEGCLPEAMAIAHHGKFKVISIDYRMPPANTFPAALEDIVAVYKEILKNYPPQNIGLFGTSSGGGLAASTVLKLRDLDLPLPGALGLGTPWSDLTKTGDTYFTNEDVDNVIVTYDGMMEAAAKLYAGSIELNDPLVSPVYGDFSKGYPPTILTTGTRDLFLSNTVRLFRKLRQAGVEAELQVFEGAPHAFYDIIFDAPESKEAFQEMVLFFNKHLGS